MVLQRKSKRTGALRPTTRIIKKKLARIIAMFLTSY